MSRAAMTTLAAASIGIALVVSACSGGSGHVNPVAASPMCPLLAQLSETGRTVAHADVNDPGKFDATLHAAVADYVRIAHRLRAAVPSQLRPDVDRLAVAAQHYQFATASAARANIDAYARSKC